jgi:hypothetical protein
MSGEQEFVGVYVSHWELPRFVVELGKGPLGLWTRTQRLFLILPAGFVLPGEPSEVRTRRSGPRLFQMRVRGSLGPKGEFGHKGSCKHELRVSEVLECHEAAAAGPVW